jgi:glycosyltransferase involved in cell wall biosynthesis
MSLRRPGLLLASPLPPAWTGVADYTARLVPHLAEDWDLTVLIGDGDPPPRDAGVRMLRMSDWERFPRLVRVDRMLLSLGNSRYHMHVPALTARHGGVVLAHDVWMTALHCLIANDSRDRHALSNVVWERHGRELGSEIRDMELRCPIQESFHEVRTRLESANAMLLGAAIPGAHAVLVHSELAARLARIELHGSLVPVKRVPFGHPTIGEPLRVPVPGRIVSFGMVEPEKRPDVMVESLAYIRQRVPNATLRFVGALGRGMEELIRSVASVVGVTGAVSWTDRVDELTYRSEFASADIAVQLRSIFNGEASAAVAECLSAGIPTVVTAIGGHSELPTSAVQATPAGCGAYDLSVSIIELLGDEDRKRQLSNGAARHAEASSFAVVARALTDALTEAPDLRGS